MKPKVFRVIGLMSGTSVDGIDAALIETDGMNHVRPLAFMPNPYDLSFRTKLRQHFGNTAGRKDPAVLQLEQELTELHAEIVQKFKQKLNGLGSHIDLIGFHGQTIWHQPEKGATIQIGDGALLARRTNIAVVNDFRTADVKAGGHGAPLTPLYHRALAATLPKPVAILNIGGVSNVSWIGGDYDDEIIAFDVGPGNALIDDWTLKFTGASYDEYGLLAANGQVDKSLVNKAMANPFFQQMPPKSLDRNSFQNLIPETLSAADGAATLTMITVQAIAHSLSLFPIKPKYLYVTGGGRLNNTMMRWISDITDIPVSSVDTLGWSGDGLEAEAFAYLAVRSRLGLPLSVPGTTGVPKPLSGGIYHKPK